MAGTKRGPDSEGPTTRSAKSAKTGATPTAGKAKKGSKAPLPASTFKSKALPLHVNVSHTPPNIEDGESEAPVDPGFIGHLALQPNSFSTGSYGWKGSKRITVELQNDSGEKEQVQVMLTFNATVLGSKQAKEEGGEDAEQADGQEPAADTTEEKVEGNEE